jgi:hypothetical protein
MELFGIVGSVVLCTMILGSAVLFIISNVVYKPEKDRNND